MATGASAAKRKAKKAAADQYYKAFSELKSANADYKASTNNKKQITEALGDDVSYGTKRLAMKADKTGRAINNDTEYRTDLKRYNSRYDALKKQLSGQSVDRYKVGGGPNALEPVKNSNPLNASYAGMGGQNNGYAGMGGQNSVGGVSMANIGMGSITNDAGAKGKAAAENRYYYSEAEAMADAKLAMEKHNASWDARLGQKAERNQSGQSGMLGFLSGGMNLTGNQTYTQAEVDRNKVNDPSRFLQKETLRGVPVGYRDLDSMESAYNEIAALSEKAGKSPVNKQAEDYAKVTEQLKQKLKREQGAVSNKPQGLLASELAGNNLLPEVIQA